MVAKNHERTEILEQFTNDRASMVPILQNIQEKEGYLSPDAVDEISDFLDVTVNDIYSVASFYAQFRFQRQGLHTVKVCQGTACHVRGGHQILEAVERELNIKPGQITTDDNLFTLERVACFGSCALAPIMVIDDRVYGRVTVAKAIQLLAECRENSHAIR